jgi:hypothetical protein
MIPLLMGIFKKPIRVIAGVGHSFYIKNYALGIDEKGVRAMWESRYGKSQSALRKYGETSYVMDKPQKGGRQ